MDRTGAGNHNNIPAGQELILVEPVDFPQSSADTVSHIGLTQLFADGNAHPIGVGAVAPGIEYKMAVGLPGSPIQSLEYVVELQ